MRRWASLLLAAAVAVSAGCSTNPKTGQRHLALIGERGEIDMGRQADQSILAHIGLYPDDSWQSYIQELGIALAALSERPDLPWTFRILDDPVANAFALPGGFIYVTRGLLTQVNSEAELASVLAHQIGHVTGRHGVERVDAARPAGESLTVGGVAGQSAGLTDEGISPLFLTFGRAHEREADDLGLRYLSRGGYRPDAMPEVLRRLQQVSAEQSDGRIPAWASTHPDPGHRAQRISEQIAALPPDPDRVKVHRAGYLKSLEGMTFGVDPRQDDPEAILDVEPKRIEVMQLDRAMSLRQFDRLYPSTIGLRQLAQVNGMTEDAKLDAGTRVKRIVGGELPPDSDSEHWDVIIQGSLEQIEVDLQRLAVLGLDDPAARELRRSIDQRRDEIRDARARLAELGVPLSIIHLDFADSTARGAEPGTPDLPALVVRNTGEGPLHIRGVAVVSDRPAEVRLGDGCSGRTLQPGEDCAIEPRFDPSELQLGWADLELNHDGQPGSYTVPLPDLRRATAAPDPAPLPVPAEDCYADKGCGGLEQRACTALQCIPSCAGSLRAVHGGCVAGTGRIAVPDPLPVSRETALVPPPPTSEAPPPTEPPPTGGEDTVTIPDPSPPPPPPPPPGGDDREVVPAGEDSGPGPGKGWTTIIFAILGALLLALIVIAAIFVASPSEFQYKVFNTTLAAGAALVVAAVVRAAGLPERATEAAGTRIAGFFTQGGSALMTFIMVYLGQPLQRLGLGAAGGAPDSASAARSIPILAVEPPPRSIFVSYRRSGTADVTGRIYEHLVQRYGDEAVFKDVEDITLGVDFRQALSNALGECRVVLAVIGPEWASHVDSEGRRRLEVPSDFVRLEIESALSRGIPLIPLLVRDASIPQPEELPASLEGLAYRNGMPVRPDPDFANDMRRLIKDIDKIFARGSGIWPPEPAT